MTSFNITVYTTLAHVKFQKHCVTQENFSLLKNSTTTTHSVEQAHQRGSPKWSKENTSHTSQEATSQDQCQMDKQQHGQNNKKNFRPRN